MKCRGANCITYLCIKSVWHQIRAGRCGCEKSPPLNLKQLIHMPSKVITTIIREPLWPPPGPRRQWSSSHSASPSGRPLGRGDNGAAVTPRAPLAAPWAEETMEQQSRRQ